MRKINNIFKGNRERELDVNDRPKTRRGGPSKILMARLRDALPEIKLRTSIMQSISSTGIQNYWKMMHNGRRVFSHEGRIE